MPKQPTPEELEKLNSMVKQSVTALLPAAVAFWRAMEASRANDGKAAALAVRDCADSVVTASVIFNELGWFD